MNRLQVGQRFSFVKIQRGVIYYKEGFGLGPYALPANYYEEEYKIAKFYDRRGFSGSEVFEVVESHSAIGGWYVLAKIVGSDVRVSFFQQLEEKGKKFVEVVVH